MKSNDLKSLQTNLKLTEESIQQTKTELTKVQKHYEALLLEKKQIEKELSASNKKLSISEHAILRYIERVFEINVDEIEKALAKNENIVKAQKTFKNSEVKIPLGDGLYAILKDSCIVTIVSK